MPGDRSRQTQLANNGLRYTWVMIHTIKPRIRGGGKREFPPIPWLTYYDYALVWSW